MQSRESSSSSDQDDDESSSDEENDEEMQFTELSQNARDGGSGGGRGLSRLSTWSGALVEMVASSQQRSPETRPTRSEQMEQGQTPSSQQRDQAQMLEAQAHMQEVLMVSYGCLFCCFSATSCVLVPMLLGLAVWLFIECHKAGQARISCDVPLLMWSRVICYVFLFHVACNRSPSNANGGVGMGTLGQRIFCCWSPDPANPNRFPLRAKIYASIIPLFLLFWDCAGLYWVGQSGKDPARKPFCKDVAPNLCSAVTWFASCSLLFAFFVFLRTFTLAQLLQVLMRRGLLPHTSEAAPPGTLESTTRPVSKNDTAVAQATCSICLENFAESDESVQPILRTIRCEHVFHRQCLEGWLRVNRTCPLCRLDLTEGARH